MVVVETLDDGFGDGLQFFEVETDPHVVYLICLDFYADFPGVAVEGSARALVAVELVGSRKVGVDEDSVQRV